MATSRSASGRRRPATLAEPERQLAVVTYDISSDSRRARVANTILSYGGRIEGSVYEVWVTDRQLERLWGAVSRQLKPGDLGRLYLLCGHCVGRIRGYGHNDSVEPVALIV